MYKPIAEDIIELNRKRFVSQTTHLICAKCGADNSISNRELLPLKYEVEADNLIRIHYNCPSCNEEYDLGLVKTR